MIATSFRFPGSLRARLALGVALPLLAALSALSLVHYWRARNLVEDQARLTAEQLGQVIMGGLRHSMSRNDRAMLNITLTDIGAMDAIQRVQIVDLAGQVRFDSKQAAIGQTRQVTDSGCQECHQYAVADRPRTSLLLADEGLLRIALPIDNAPACAECHAAAFTHLGVLLADAPILFLQQRLLRDLQIDLATSAGLTLAVTLSVYLLVHWLVVRRVESLRQPLAAFAGGDFSARLPMRRLVRDELDELGRAFNRMADELERHAREQQERSELRQKTIVEERERIARELHDGVAQLLGYVNTKAMAARLLLKKHQVVAAEDLLRQLEEAARESFVEVREAILGLRTTGRVNGDLPTTLKEYAAQFSQMNGLPVEVVIGPEVGAHALSPEVEVQLLRIVQEALTNIRKHAGARRAWVRMGNGAGFLHLTVADDGQGFDPADIEPEPPGHFGLSTMRERAEGIGAEFALESAPGNGTRVSVRLPVKKG